MKPKVYIETSIPSFYYEARTEPDMVARRDWTREWWSYASDNYVLVTSLAVDISEKECRDAKFRVSTRFLGNAYLISGDV
jgi:hypothetical protein